MKNRSKYLLAAAFLTAAAFSTLPAASVKLIPANEGIENVSVESDLFVDGLKASKVKLSYAKKLHKDSVSIDDYRIEGRVITDVQVDGKDVILVLDCANKLKNDPNWNSMDDLPYETQLTVTQTGDVSSSNEKIIFSGSYSVTTPAYPRPAIVEQFSEKSFLENRTGLKFRYNIYLPEKYTSGWNYPLVIFIPDEHVNTDTGKAVLLQGQGGTIWATKQEQSKHKCIVIAVQYPLATQQAFGPLVSDDGSMTKGLVAVKALIEDLCKNYRIDKSRIYGVGQAQGANALMTLAENNPDLFAGLLLVAPQKQTAAPEKLAGQKIWLQVSEGDHTAFSRANLITDSWETAGVRVAYGKWRAEDDARQQESAVSAMISQKAPVNCGVFEGGNRPYTWSQTYGIEGIRDWLFRQHR